MMKLSRRAHLTAMLAATLAVLTVPLFVLALYWGEYVSAASNFFVFGSCVFMYRTNSGLRDTSMRLHTMRQMALAAEATVTSVVVEAGACPRCDTEGKAAPCGLVVVMECQACHHQWPAPERLPTSPHRVH